VIITRTVSPRASSSTFTVTKSYETRF
jgi:hypothetical protein